MVKERLGKEKGAHTKGDLDWKHTITFHQFLTAVWSGTASVKKTFLYHLPREATVAFQEP